MKYLYKILNTKSSVLIILFISFIFFFFTSCDKEVSVTPPEQAPPNGKLFVDSDPQGAYIYLNGKNTGNITPDTINWLEERKYILSLKKNLFKDYSTTVNVSLDSVASFFLDYYNVSGISGTLYLDSSPRGAEIFLNGVSTGKKTLATIENLFPGTYDVRLKLSGFWDANQSIEVKSGATIYPFITLTDSLTWANFSTDNSELPDNFINHVAIEKGFIKWIATTSGGLARFDDKSWVIYNSANSPLPINNIKFVGIDNQNRKWICVSRDLIVFDDNSWTVYNSSNSIIPEYNITSVAFDEQNSVWIGTYGGGIVHFDGVDWEIYNTSNSNLLSDIINTIAIDKSNNKWIGTYNRGIARFDGQYWTIYNNFKSGVQKNASHIAIDLNNTPWVAIGTIFHFLLGGSAYFDGILWQASISVPSSNVLYIGVDSQNQKWFCNSEDGLSKLNNGAWIHFKTSNSRLPNDRVFAIAFDGAGNKWIATYGGGLAKYKGN